MLRGGLQVLDAVGIAPGLHIDMTEDLLHGAVWDRYGTSYARRRVISGTRRMLCSSVQSADLVERRRGRRRAG